MAVPVSETYLHYLNYCETMNQRFQEDIFFACRFLETRGMKYLQEYDWENAIALASEIMVKEMGDWK